MREDERASFLKPFEAAWQRAASGCGDQVVESFYEFAGHSSRIRIVGRRLAQHVHRTFAHLQHSGCEAPALRIQLWDGRATGIECPASQPADSETIAAQIGTGRVTISEGGRVFAYRRPDSVTCLDRAEGAMVGWRADGEKLSIEERSKPIPLLLRIWYYDRNIDIIHAGLVARANRGVLIGGHAGAGKSTTALACVANGFDFLGDDEVGLESQGDNYTGHSLYGSTRLHRGPHNPFFREIEMPSTSDTAAHEKPLYFAIDLAPQRMRRKVRVATVALPRITPNRHSRLLRVSPAQAVLRLGATSLFTALGLGDRVFERLQNLVASVPCYSLELGKDAASTAPCVEQMLAEAT